MQYTEIDIKLDEVVPFSEIIIAKLDLLNFDIQENENMQPVTGGKNQSMYMWLKLE